MPIYTEAEFDNNDLYKIYTAVIDSGGASTLAEVLAEGNLTGGFGIYSDDEKSALVVIDNLAKLAYDNGAGDAGQFQVTASGLSAGWGDGVNSGAYVVTASQSLITHTDEIEYQSPIHKFSTGSVGIGVTPSAAKFQVLSTTEQVRIAYDSSNFYKTTVGSNGLTTFDSLGSGAAFRFDKNVAIGGAPDATWQFYSNATSGRIAAGVFFNNNITGGTQYGISVGANAAGNVINTAGYFSATGATSNYAVYCNDGDIRIVQGRLGVNIDPISPIRVNINSSTSDSQGLRVILNSTGATTNYCIIGSAEGTNAGTNIAGYFNSVNGYTNYAIVVPTGGGNVGLGTVTPNAAAILDLSTTTQGLLLPRMTTVQKNAISSPVSGLMVYDTTLGKLCVYTTAWETITSI